MNPINPLNKPVVFYKGKATPFMDRAVLFPVNHPNHLDGHEVSNTHQVVTSRVLAWSLTTGCIETQNTIYTPFLEDNTDKEVNSSAEIVLRDLVKFTEVQEHVL